MNKNFWNNFKSFTASLLHCTDLKDFNFQFFTLLSLVGILKSVNVFAQVLEIEEEFFIDMIVALTKPRPDVVFLLTYEYTTPNLT